MLRKRGSLGPDSTAKNRRNVGRETLLHPFVSSVLCPHWPKIPSAVVISLATAVLLLLGIYFSIVSVLRGRSSRHGLRVYPW